MKTFTRDQVSKHNQETDSWIIIDHKVFDITRFAPLHPGGEKILLQYGGTDATDDFYSLHRSEVLEKYGPRLQIGTLASGSEKFRSSFNSVSVVPYAEPSYWRGLHSPYYNQSHVEYRKALREFVHAEMREYAEECETKSAVISKDFLKKLGDFGLFAAAIGPGPHLKFVDKLPGNINPENFDYFHELITHEEVSRLGTPGFQDGCFGGKNISITPLMVFGNERMRKEIVPKSLKGLCKTCLAITEPFAGSDVAGIRTTAVKSPCGNYYIVNGVKKWITEAMNAQYFITAVRTGGPGKGGVSMLLIERGEGINTKLIKTAYSTSAETSLVTFEDVKVPVENLMAKENEGFRAIMYNFNHERWYIVVIMLSRCRFILEECFKWASQRQIFGKPLINQAVIQEKLAKMASSLESCYSWLETITHQMNEMSFEEYNAKIGGDIALLKYQAAMVSRIIADESVQIFGGRGVSSSGMGKYIERYENILLFISTL